MCVCECVSVCVCMCVCEYVCVCVCEYVCVCERERERETESVRVCASMLALDGGRLADIKSMFTPDPCVRGVMRVKGVMRAYHVKGVMRVYMWCRDGHN